MKGHITRHDWTYGKERCIHCGLKESSILISRKLITVWIQGIVTFWEEPDCITRKLNAPQR